MKLTLLLFASSFLAAEDYPHECRADYEHCKHTEITPEPATVLLMGGGLLALIAVAKWKRSR